jgi:hypothetical protein
MDNSGSTCTFGTMATLVVRGGGMVVWSRRTIKGEVEVMRSWWWDLGGGDGRSGWQWCSAAWTTMSEIKMARVHPKDDTTGKGEVKPRPGLRGPVPPMPRTDSVGKPLLTLLFALHLLSICCTVSYVLLKLQITPSSTQMFQPKPTPFTFAYITLNFIFSPDTIHFILRTCILPPHKLNMINYM